MKLYLLAFLVPLVAGHRLLPVHPRDTFPLRSDYIVGGQLAPNGRWRWQVRYNFVIRSFIYTISVCSVLQLKPKKIDCDYLQGGRTEDDEEEEIWSEIRFCCQPNYRYDIIPSCVIYLFIFFSIFFPLLGLTQDGIWIAHLRLRTGRFKLDPDRSSLRWKVDYAPLSLCH